MSSTSGNATVMGHINEADGPVMVVNQDGEQRILEAGDAVYFNEQIITPAGASASIQLMDNRIVSVQEQSSLVLNDSFRSGLAADAEAKDSRGNSSQASVDINITGVNDTPEVATQVQGYTDQNGEALSLNLLEHASDVNGDDSLYVSRIQLKSGNEEGVSLSPSGNELLIDPQAYKYLAEGEQETLAYEYRVSDLKGTYFIQTAEIVITGKNDQPTVSSAVIYQGSQNAGSLTINLLDGSGDIDVSDTHSVVSLKLEAGDPQAISYNSRTNTLELDSSAYDELAEGETETVVYSYQVDDEHGGQIEQTATLETEGFNDAPTSQDSQVTIDEDTPYIFAVTDFPFSNVDTSSSLQSLKIISLTVSGNLLLNGTAITADQEVSRTDLITGRLKFEPATGEHSNNYASFQFQVGDGELYSEAHTFCFDVTPANYAPEIGQSITVQVSDEELTSVNAPPVVSASISKSSNEDNSP